MANKGPKLPDITTILAAGINPKTGLPIKLGLGSSKDLSPELLKALRIIDEQDAVNRGRWYNLPGGISSQELERMLYYKGQLAFFYFKELNQFYFMPYALEGEIDFYRRYRHIHPIPFSYGTEDEKGKKYKDQYNILSTIKLKCIYDVITEEDDITEELLTQSCVLLHDYTPQWSEVVIPRQLLQEPTLQVMSEIIPFMRTAMIKNTGISGIRVQSGDESQNVEDANAAVEIAAKTGRPYIPVVGTVDFQDFGAQPGIKTAQEYMLALQSLDNFRLSAYGIENGGLFEKKAHELEQEQAINNTPVGLVMQDATSQRQRFCNIVNSIWGLNVWYEPSENISSADINGDGLTYDRDVEGGVQDDDTEQ